MPNFNGSEYLDEAIQSVLHQNYNNIELIVVDDGSTDSSVHILKKYGSKIKFITQSNSGAASARNVGMSHAKGEIIALIDADDIWHLDKISKQVEILLENNLNLVYWLEKVTNHIS